MQDLKWHKVIIGALVAWLVISLFTGSFASVSSLAGLALFAISLWFLGSFALRILGWIFVFWGLIAAHWDNATGLATVGRVSVGIALWLCGHWFFTYRKGYWRSLIAFKMLSKLPSSWQPDRHFGGTPF